MGERPTKSATSDAGLWQTPPYNITNVAEAEGLVTLPDSWITLHDEFPASNDNRSVTLSASTMPQVVLDTFDSFDIDGDGTIEANEVSGEGLRVVLFSQDGKLSEVRFIRDRTQIDAGNVVTWPTTQAALPGNNQYFDNKVSRVRIEVRERRFTWLLTVREYQHNSSNNTASASVDVVIFFRRSPSLEDETLYELGDDADGNRRTYIVNKITGTDPNPFLKKGGYMLDTTNGKWYRVAKVDEATQTVTLEGLITSDLSMPTPHQVVFMRGVVEVYELGRKSLP